MDYKGLLEIEGVTDGDHLKILIRDSGPGIDESIKDKIFEPFFTTKPAGEGSGLGLDICRKIIEDHRGNISVTSRPGRTEFTVTLPLSAPDAG
jgi:signal transduction histidine kinase